ncbi:MULTISPECIES: sugar kinase [unclassified Nocardioides]|uniref:sugar kinase n=1 Tax=unclassified Nocardioides TaxID=2615069 RepID=UPI00361E7222
MTGLLTFGETLALASSTTPGNLAQATTLDLGIGGAESNVAIGVRRLGGRATWVGRVGADSLGTRVVRELRAEDVDARALVDDAAPTALMIKERRTTEAGKVWYYRTGSAGSRLSSGDLPEELVAAAGVLHLTGITPALSDTALAATRHAVATATAARVPISFDVNHRLALWRGRDAAPTYAELARAAAVVFAGEDEARLLTGCRTDEPDELLAALAAASGGDAVLKLGADGCLARIDDVTHRVPAVPVTVVDTVGAGDAFVAGYLAELLLDRPADERLATAVRCGALACASSGDWEGLPTRADLSLLDGGESVTR